MEKLAYDHLKLANSNDYNLNIASRKPLAMTMKFSTYAKKMYFEWFLLKALIKDLMLFDSSIKVELFSIPIYLKKLPINGEIHVQFREIGFAELPKTKHFISRKSE